ncbi:hypothetical protein HDV00_012552 [Rhizophlyctis rosea]|nr:hypothetical protein HDV00_012552 [Rhizophlyctis rosea]
MSSFACGPKFITGDPGANFWKNLPPPEEVDAYSTIPKIQKETSPEHWNDFQVQNKADAQNTSKEAIHAQEAANHRETDMAALNEMGGTIPQFVAGYNRDGRGQESTPEKGMSYVEPVRVKEARRSGEADYENEDGKFKRVPRS